MADEKQIRILLAVDRESERKNLAALVSKGRGIVVVGEAGTGVAALALAAGEQPDIILLDSDLDGHADFALMPALLGAVMHARIILLGASLTAEAQREALRLGASAVLDKEASAASLFQCISSVHSGFFWLDGATISTLLKESGGQQHACRCSRNSDHP